jgi:hypothetical protein
MNTSEVAQLQTGFATLFQGFKMLSNGFFQMNARLDALKAIVCELHPEMAAQLEDKIRQDQNAATKEFADLRRMLELLDSSVSGQTH